jgi:hypothetical protein
MENPSKDDFPIEKISHGKMVGHVEALQDPSLRIRVAGDVKLPGHIFGQRRGPPTYGKSSNMKERSI